jgi:hypothetical protein
MKIVNSLKTNKPSVVTELPANRRFSTVSCTPMKYQQLSARKYPRCDASQEAATARSRLYSILNSDYFQ